MESMLLVRWSFDLSYSKLSLTPSHLRRDSSIFLCYLFSDGVRSTYTEGELNAACTTGRMYIHVVWEYQASVGTTVKVCNPWLVFPRVFGVSGASSEAPWTPLQPDWRLQPGAYRFSPSSQYIRTPYRQSRRNQYTTLVAWLHLLALNGFLINMYGLAAESLVMQNG